MASTQPPEPEASYADLAIAAIRDGRYHAARGWLAEALDAQREARDAQIRQVPVLRMKPMRGTLDAADEALVADVADKLGNRGPWRA